MDFGEGFAQLWRDAQRNRSLAIAAWAIGLWKSFFNAEEEATGASRVREESQPHNFKRAA